MLTFVDTHCHLNFCDFDSDIEKVLEKARQNGIQKILIPGIDIDTSRKAVELAEKYTDIYAAVGIHPNAADLWNAEIKNELKLLCKSKKVIAIGEIGLDFYHNNVAQETQHSALSQQLNIAMSHNLPVLLHSRNAVTELLDCLVKHFGVENTQLHKGIFHAFEGNLTEANAIIRSGFYLGVAGHITFKRNEVLRNVLETLTPNCVVFETDSPYLSPEPYRGIRNEPSNISKIASFCSQIMNVSMEELSSKTTLNARNLFRWSFTGE